VIGVFGASLLWSTPARLAEVAPQKATPSPPNAPAAASVSFETIAANAARAREANAVDEAIRWYRRGVQMRPRWDEGWWYLATLLYDRDRYAESRDAFTRLLRLKPDAGPAWALRGLCRFQLKDYETALADLSKWASEGERGNAETGLVALYHLAILRIRGGQFELALAPMTQLCSSGPESPQLVRVAGLMLLRMQSFPGEVPKEKQEMVDVAGRAYYSWLAQRTDEARVRFKELIDRYPEAPNAHYCYGLFLRSQGSGEALAEFQEEMKVQPSSVYPRLEMAFDLIKRGDYSAARPYAEDAVKLAPGLFAAHNALGRVLVELDQLQRGIGELEEAARLAPETPEMFHALAHAYDVAGRTEDAEKARATFLELEQRRRENETLPLAQGDPAPRPTSPRRQP
jgi:tetratricopeptide (TPR) repeat protein